MDMSLRTLLKSSSRKKTLGEGCVSQSVSCVPHGAAFDEDSGLMVTLRCLTPMGGWNPREVGMLEGVRTC